MTLGTKQIGKTKPISKIMVKNRFNFVVSGVGHKTLYDENSLENRQSTRQDPNSTQSLKHKLENQSNNSYKHAQTTQARKLSS